MKKIIVVTIVFLALGISSSHPFSQSVLAAAGDGSACHGGGGTVGGPGYIRGNENPFLGEVPCRSS